MHPEKMWQKPRWTEKSESEILFTVHVVKAVKQDAQANFTLQVSAHLRPRSDLLEQHEDVKPAIKTDLADHLNVLHDRKSETLRLHTPQQ